MSAPNLATLFDFEGQFEAAAQASLAASGVTAYLSQAAIKLPLLNTGIAFDVGAALDELTFLPKPSTWPVDQPPPQDYFRYVGALELRVEVPRDDNGASVIGVDTMLSQVRGLIRAAFMRVMAPFNDANLPYYRVTDIVPAGSVTGQEQPRNVDFCSLRFTVSFQIKPDAWPAWIIPSDPLTTIAGDPLFTINGEQLFLIP